MVDSQPGLLAPIQRSLTDLGTPLIDVTFCVLDLETTGGSPDDDRICEIGAVKVRGGDCLGTFHTMVDPGRPIPPAITMLTGLTTAVVTPAPRVGEILPTLEEFMADTVFVGHNVRFDRSFLDAARVRAGYERLGNPTVDTCALARRLLAEEVPNCKLETLATRFRLDHRPSHRALDDALATTDLLHLLLERAAGLGVVGLDDLLALPSAGAHPQASKLRMTDHLPRSPGVYLFRDAAGRVLYVGKASNLRSRVRSYFSSDTRRKVGGLLRETARIDHMTAPTPLDAAVNEIRLIHEHLPRYNRQGTTWRKSAYLKLTDEAFPRLSVVRQVRDDATYLGPLPSARVAKRVAEAVESAVPLRRCTADPARADRPAPCAPAQLGVSVCPCAADIDVEGYRPIAEAARRALTEDPAVVSAPLSERMGRLAAAQRFEEAADVRDRLAAFVQAHDRVRRFDVLRRAGRFSVRYGDRRAVFAEGHLVATEPIDAPTLFGSAADVPSDRIFDPADRLPPTRPADADEMTVVYGWLIKNAARLRIESVSGTLCSPLPRLPDVTPATRSGDRHVSSTTRERNQNGI